ncbi:hypothetical protein CKF54_07455 [Psittacicella hinzii]|uniref:ATP-binding protein Uup n=1 Tax=Psittacicella hinzii TaxID=2028575 RepID=A0A3A1Y107_9GAMM|nr:ATP-binding cassette domain-containing protein [Psittacicella hinzii]RIY31141.1 hypothetical protein CKF54_07455 [Psittacicella hinzii]
MSLVRLTDANLSFGSHVILDNINLSIENHERVCIVGRNGSGKSTLLKVILGSEDLDSGSRILETNVRIAYLRQDPPERLDITTYEYVASGAAHAQAVLEQHQQALLAYSQTPTAELERLISQLEEEINTGDYWSLDKRIAAVLTQLGIPAERKLQEFSGGWLRRVELAKAFVSNPNVLLLDEPTNHLDISSIQWLENSLQSFPGAIVFISHDRAFVDHMATRIVELDRGHVYDHPGSFSGYLDGRNKRLEDEKKQVALFEKNLAEEEKWIRKGIEARRTRNEGRVRALKAMRVEAQNMRKLSDFGSINVQTTRSGKLVFEITELGLELGGRTIFTDFTNRVSAKSRIAIVGDNGCGKSSLIKVLLHELEPTHGSVHIGTNLEVAYFDQLRAELDLDKTAIDNVFDGKVEAYVNGHVRHAIGYLGDFMFTAEKARTKVSSLSGGERNRLLLAKILAKPSNLLVLDEPTNDLDIETLELLEELVSEYDGTILIVSHDRQFIDNVAVETWFIDQQKVYPYVGGYSDNVVLHQQLLEAEQAKALAAQAKAASKVAGKASSTNNQELTGQGSVANANAHLTQQNGVTASGATTSKSSNTATSASQASATSQATAGNGRVQNRTERLSYKEKQDLLNIPNQLEELEAEMAQLLAEIEELGSNPNGYLQLEEKTKLLNAKQELSEELQERWLELEEKRERLGEVL